MGGQRPVKHVVGNVLAQLHSAAALAGKVLPQHLAAVHKPKFTLAAFHIPHPAQKRLSYLIMHAPRQQGRSNGCPGTGQTTLGTSWPSGLHSAATLTREVLPQYLAAIYEPEVLLTALHVLHRVQSILGVANCTAGLVGGQKVVNTIGNVLTQLHSAAALTPKMLPQHPAAVHDPGIPFAALHKPPPCAK